MATFYIDDGATGANNGTSPTDAWQSLSDYVAQAAGSVIEVVAGSGPYRELFDVKGNGASGNHVIWNFNGCKVTAASDMNGPAYKWTPSGSGTNEYYLELSGGGNPSLVETKCVTVDGFLWIVAAETSHTLGAVGSLSDKQPAWGDNDTLGFNTVYIRSDGGEPNAAGLNIEGSQRDYNLDTNWRYHTFNQVIFEHGNIANINARQTSGLAADWLFHRNIFAYANLTGIESLNGSFTATSSLFYWTGHRAISIGTNVTAVSIKTYNCTEWGAHVFALIDSGVDGTATLDTQNCVSANNEAGSIDKKSATAVLVENNNMWYPRMTAAGGALGYVSTTNWPTTDAVDIPASTATTLSDQGLLQDPQFVSAVDNGYNNSDFRIKNTSPSVGAGVDVGVTEYFDGTVIVLPPNIGAYVNTASGNSGRGFNTGSLRFGLDIRLT